MFPFLNIRQYKKIAEINDRFCKNISINFCPMILNSVARASP